jgi:hypothetical protein
VERNRKAGQSSPRVVAPTEEEEEDEEEEKEEEEKRKKRRKERDTVSERLCFVRKKTTDRPS